MLVLASFSDTLANLIFGPYWIGAFGFGIYAWAQYTKGLSPIERRLRAMGYGLGWPYFAFRLYQQRDQTVAASAEADDARRRIMGD